MAKIVHCPASNGYCQEEFQCSNCGRRFGCIKCKYNATHPNRNINCFRCKHMKAVTMGVACGIKKDR